MTRKTLETKIRILLIGESVSCYILKNKKIEKQYYGKVYDNYHILQTL